MKRDRGLFSLQLFLGLLGNCLRPLLLTVSRLTRNTYQILIIVLLGILYQVLFSGQKT